MRNQTSTRCFSCHKYTVSTRFIKWIFSIGLFQHNKKNIIGKNSSEQEIIDWLLNLKKDLFQRGIFPFRAWGTYCDEYSIISKFNKLANKVVAGNVISYLIHLPSGYYIPMG